MALDASEHRIWNDEQQSASRDSQLCNYGYNRQQPTCDASVPSQPYPRPPHLLPVTGPSEHQLSSKSRSSRLNAPYHPYKANQTSPPPPSRSQPSSVSPPPSAASLPKAIHFVDSTFQPGDSNGSTSSSGNLPHCRPKRKKITHSQLTKLLEVFDTTDNPGFDVRDNVGRDIGMSNREVQVWFQNRRAKVTRERTTAIAKANPSHPPLLSSDTLPSPARSSSAPRSVSSTSSSSVLSTAQHQWRFSNPRPNLTQYSQPSPQAPHSRSASRTESEVSVPHYRQAFGEQRILLPRATSPLPSPEVSSNASEASSSYFTNSLTPPLSYTATTPGADSPTWTTRGLPDHARTHESPLLPFGSPAVAFDRLALRSPPIHSNGPERAPFFFAAEMPSPTLSEPEEMIHLAPIRGGWRTETTPKSSTTFTTSRRRSSSNPVSPSSIEKKSSRPSHVRLPSLRDLLNPMTVDTPTTTPALTPSISTTSTSASPVTPRSHSPFVGPAHSSNAAPRRPHLVSRHTTDVVPPAYSPAYRSYISGPGVGLGVLSATSHRTESQRPQSVLYNPY